MLLSLIQHLSSHINLTFKEPHFSSFKTDLSRMDFFSFTLFLLEEKTLKS